LIHYILHYRIGKEKEKINVQENAFKSGLPSRRRELKPMQLSGIDENRPKRQCTNILG
jgi:hypothetical protein